MTEERGPYDLHAEDPDCDLAGVERIGDVVRQFIDERGWPLTVSHTRANGHSAGGDHQERYPDA